MRKQYQAGRFGIGTYKRTTRSRNGRKGPSKLGLRITAVILALIVLVLLFFSVKITKDKKDAIPDKPVLASVTMDMSQIDSV